MVEAQLAKWSLSTPGPQYVNVLKNWIYCQYRVPKYENKEKRSENSPFKNGELMFYFLFVCQKCNDSIFISSKWANSTMKSGVFSGQILMLESIGVL